MPEVPGGAAVDVVVTLAFLLFVLSVVSAAVAERIANAPLLHPRACLHARSPNRDDSDGLENSPPGVPG